MAKQDPIQRRREALYVARDNPSAPESVALLRRGLSDRASLVVAKAAELAGELGLGVLTPELEAAFERLMLDPTKKDKGCLGKTAVVTALVKLDHADADVFLSAAGHRQHEPVWGGTADTAAEMRGIAAEGLVACRHPEVMDVLVDLLADEEKPARLGAIRALSRLAGNEGALLLRLKAHHGDADVEVVGECFNALAVIGPPVPVVAFLARFLDEPDAAVAESAVLALGETRHEAAVEVLRERFEITFDRERRAVLLSALALSRTESAKTFLLTLVGSAALDTARAALDAIAPFLYDGELARRVRESVEKRGEPELTEHLSKTL